jgi:flagellin
MSAVLNTNVASLWASKNLLGAQTKLATSVERLASGLRINRARDDAAGLGVANSLTAQINGANQGIRNLNDAVSSMQTGEGAIAAAQEMGQRILMLATQGANSTLSSEQRTSIVDEMKKLLIAIDAIGDRTSFSSNKLLSYDASATRKATLYSMQISNTSTDRVSLDSDAFIDVGGLVGRNGATNFTSVTAGNTGDITLASALPTNIIGKTVYAINEVTGALTTTNLTVKEIKSDNATGTVYTLSAGATAGTVINANQLLAFGDGKITARVGNQPSLGVALESSNLTLDPAANPETNPPLITEAWQQVQKSADLYVRSLTTQRGLMGAYQNQMEFTLSNLTELSSNLSSARSRVMDTDYANETAALTKGQILQQAATAMLAQANQMPNVILTLLK